ncbi:GNAT family N-acetyltransferase [Geothrix sp. 21YS21S-4]|uniref:GNAT family N-acetyltransferase n=1 Tax=Geothrix sp. 21YS21S-4 TaxID=3068889 RepID=UPI0027B8D5B9|nr:GNAT family N-acetyltransferase [Geothrix sp. 21YS21S-4]
MDRCDLSFDPARFQFDRIHALLSHSYWTPGLGRERVERAFAHSLAIGAFHGTEQVGCARLVTDRTSFGYLADVMVHEAHRSRGLGRAMTRALLDHPEVRTLRRILLVTRDAHGLYAACGFEPLEDPAAFMQIHRPFQG